MAAKNVKRTEKRTIKGALDENGGKVRVCFRVDYVGKKLTA